MSVFQSIAFAWQGRNYTIPSTETMRVFDAVEDIAPFSRWVEYHSTGSAPVGKMARAAGAILRHVGVDVTDEDVLHATISDVSRAKEAGAMVATVICAVMPVSPVANPKGKSSKKSAPPTG